MLPASPPSELSLTEPSSLAELRRTFEHPPPEARPMMRWWWFGPEVARTDIERDLTAMAAAGIGGVEVSYVYPLVEHPTRLGSEEFLADLAYAADVAERLGLRFDVTLGSGWSFGGPHIGPEHAARRLRWERREIGPAALQIAGGRQAWPGDELIGVYLGAGSLQEPPETYESLPIGADGVVEVPGGAGTRVVLTATAGLTGQNVKRAAAGAEGPVHDHYDAAAVRRHLTALGDRLIAAVGAHRLGSVFCDSLEVYHADWTPTLPAEFARRRGYQLEPELWRLVDDGPASAGFRADYHRTLSELYEDNFLVPLADWAHGHGVPLRVQSYGEPPATLASYAQVDGIEGEQWGWTRMPPTKWASSAAHHLGVPIVSSETWTWVHAPSFRATPLDLLGEAHEHFLLGVNQLIGHGWPCSPRPDGPGLGWFFYASAALDDRNAWWPAAADLMAYLQRLSGLLRLGEPVRDVLLYLPTTDAYARLGTATSLDLWRTLAAMIDPRVIASLRSAGYDLALLDDGLAALVEPAADLVVLLPGRTTVPAATRAWLDRVEAAGGRVLTVDGDDDAATLVGRHLAPDLTLHPSRADVGMVHRRIDDLDVHLVVNTGPHRRTQRVVPRDARSRIEVWDPKDGAVVSVTTDPGPNGIEVALAPYQALVLVGHDGDPSVVGRPSAGGREPTGTPSARRGLATPPPRRHRRHRRHRSGRGVAPPPLGGRPADRAGLLRHARLRHHDQHPAAGRSDPARPGRRPPCRRRRSRPGAGHRGPLLPGAAGPAGRRGGPGAGRRCGSDDPVGAAVRLRPDRSAAREGQGHAATGGVEHDGQRLGGGRHRGRLGG